MGIIVSQHKDPYKPISIMECHKGLVHAFPFSKGGQALRFQPSDSGGVASGISDDHKLTEL